mmetsp:Transcript_66952/g.153390  ORF Transcript_66952/g.153390 Transcript_66952/m.153390 type:complete len:343 (+) Transcript_66952:28-1056(+)
MLQPGRARPPMKILTWNVLAAEYTTHQKKFHRAEKFKGREAPWQTKCRFRRIRSRILAEKADFVLLQEFHTNSWRETLEMEVDKLFPGYMLYDADPSGPVAAVLVGKSWECKDLIQIQGSKTVTGGSSKTAVGVAVQLPDGLLWVISAHFQYFPQGFLEKKFPDAKQQFVNLANAIEEQLWDRGAESNDYIIIGADFNADRHYIKKSAMQHIDKMIQGLFLERLQQSEDVGPTALDADWSGNTSIDMFYFGPGVVAREAQRQKSPHCPYHPKDVVEPAGVMGDSDHVWVSMVFEVCWPPPEVPPSVRMWENREDNVSLVVEREEDARTAETEVFRVAEGRTL